MGLEKREEQAKETENILNKMIVENFPNLEKKIYLGEDRTLKSF
jgi:hypothetical protein